MTIEEREELFDKNLKLNYENNLKYSKQLENMSSLFEKLDRYLDKELNEKEGK
jgi:hypothetical protein